VAILRYVLDLRIGVSFSNTKQKNEPSDNKKLIEKR
jgi:hypothetical protein